MFRITLILGKKLKKLLVYSHASVIKVSEFPTRMFPWIAGRIPPTLMVGSQSPSRRIWETITFAGAWEGKPVESAYEEFGKVFRELAELAEEKGVKLGIENCLMDGTWEHATCNIGFNPKAWEVMFEEVKNDNFGLEWEPTHQMVQLIDPVTELRKWCKKIVHVHGKDATIDWDAVRHGGISGAVPFVWHRMPGFGDTNWRDIISILRSNGYEDDICIEGYHDPVYNGELEMTGQLHALNYLKWCRGGEFTPTPWEK